MTRIDHPHRRRAARGRTALHRGPSSRPQETVTRGGTRPAAPAVRRPPRGELSLRRELAGFLEVVYHALPSPAALAFLRELDAAEREAALFDYAGHLGEQGIVPPLVQRRITALRQFVASLS
jgi:hypothetical protein